MRIRNHVRMNGYQIENLGPPTQAKYAVTKEFVEQLITDLINGAPAALDTLKEIADQLAADQTAAAAIVTSITNLVTDLASTADGKGANLIGIEDADGHFTSTTVEAALAEIANIIADLPGRFSADVTGTATQVTVDGHEYNIQHNLGTEDVIIQIRETTGKKWVVMADAYPVDSNNVRVVFSETLGSTAYRVTVLA